MAHASPVASNGEYLSDQESKPSEFGSEKSLSSVKSTVGLVTPKLEPIPYYPNAASTSAQHIKDIKPAVSNSHINSMYIKISRNFIEKLLASRNWCTACYAIFTPNTHDAFGLNLVNFLHGTSIKINKSTRAFRISRNLGYDTVAGVR